jgi:hypothetical protein
VVKLPDVLGCPAFVAQRIEHLTTDQKVGGSSPSKRTLSPRTAIPQLILKFTFEKLSG